MLRWMILGESISEAFEERCWKASGECLRVEQDWGLLWAVGQWCYGRLGGALGKVRHTFGVGSEDSGRFGLLRLWSFLGLRRGASIVRTRGSGLGGSGVWVFVYNLQGNYDWGQS